MTERARDEFDDLDGPGERHDRQDARRRNVFVDESYDGGGYMGREGGERDTFDIAVDREPVGFSDEPAEAVRREAPDFDFDAVKARRQPTRSAEATPPRASASRPAPERPERGPGRRDPGGPEFEGGRGGGRRRRATPVEEESGSGGVWAFTLVLSLIWVAGVLAFSVGYFRMPVAPVAALLDAATRLQPHLQLMIGAVAVAPLAVIWSAAFVARRARAVAIEGRRLGAIVARMESVSRAVPRAPGEGAPALDSGLLEDIAERVTARLAQSEERAEIQAEEAARLLESERAALNGLLQDIEAEASRLAQIAAKPAPSAPAPAAPDIDIEAIAAAVAARIPRPEPAPAPAPAALRREAPVEPARERTPAPSSRRTRVAPEPEPEAPAVRSSGQGRESTRDAMLRAAQAAASLGQRSDSRRVGAYEADDSFDDGDEAFDPEFDADLDGDLDEFDERPPVAASASGLDWDKLVTAANFPENEEDKATLDALMEVINDKQVADVLQSAEDVLSSLADANLFMEDITPHHAPAEKWRGYILEGDRRDLIDLGGVRDPHAIEEATNALQERDGFDRTALVFLDRYESLLERMFQEAPSNKLAVELADTRTGRAYMLLARVTGRFG